MYVNDGGLVVSGYFYSHDMGSGWIEKPHDRTYQFYNNTVLVSAIQKAYMMYGTDTVFNDWRTVKVFVKEKNQWKMAGVSYSPLQVNYTKPGNANSKLYPEYTGVYKAGSFPADTILLKDGTLYESQTGVREKILPLDDSTFILKDDLGKVIFGKNSGGKVTNYTYVRYDGQRIHASKIN